MLGNWRTHEEYQSYLFEKIFPFFESDKKNVEQYKDALLSVSGDGTCVNSSGSSFGNKECNCKDNGNYNCDCKRRFSDLHARWGWDSCHGQWFYGYTEYTLSVYNKNLKCDLPLYLRLVQAQRHDGIAAIVALWSCND